MNISPRYLKKYTVDSVQVSKSERDENIARCGARDWPSVESLTFWNIWNKIGQLSGINCNRNWVLFLANYLKPRSN